MGTLSAEEKTRLGRAVITGELEPTLTVAERRKLAFRHIGSGLVLALSAVEAVGALTAFRPVTSVAGNVTRRVIRKKVQAKIQDLTEKEAHRSLSRLNEIMDQSKVIEGLAARFNKVQAHSKAQNLAGNVRPLLGRQQSAHVKDALSAEAKLRRARIGALNRMEDQGERSLANQHLAAIADGASAQTSANTVAGLGEAAALAALAASGKPAVATEHVIDAITTRDLPTPETFRRANERFMALPHTRQLKVIPAR